MKIDRIELLNILTAIKPGLNKNSFIEQENNFSFTGKEIITYNNEIAISYPYKSNLNCSVPADKFYKLVSNIDAQNFIITQKNNNLEIRSSKLKAEIQTINLDNKDIIELIKPSNVDIKWIKLPNNFKKGIELCLFSLSDNYVRPGLECLFINYEQIISCDNFRMSQYTLSEALECKFLLPGTAAKEVIKFNITHYYLSEAWIYFKTDEGIIFCSRYKPSDIYPSTKGFLKIEERKEIILPKGLKNNINTSAIMAEENINHNKKITVTLKDNKITCRGENDIGYIESFISIDSEENIIFKINPLFFLQVLDKSNVMIYSEKRKRLLFESNNFKHVLVCWG